MKICSLFILAMTLFSVSGTSQSFLDSIPMDEDGRVRYELIFEAPGTKDQLYDKSKLWLANSFRSAKSVIESEDKEGGYIVGSGSILYPFTFYAVRKKEVKELEKPFATVHFGVSIYVKEGKAKIVLTDISFIGNTDIFNNRYTKTYINLVREKLASNKLEEQARAQTDYSRFIGISKMLVHVTLSYESALKKKSEADF